MRCGTCGVVNVDHLGGLRVRSGDAVRPEALPARARRPRSARPVRRCAGTRRYAQRPLISRPSVSICPPAPLDRGDPGVEVLGEAADVVEPRSRLACATASRARPSTSSMNGGPCDAVDQAPAHVAGGPVAGRVPADRRSRPSAPPSPARGSPPRSTRESRALQRPCGARGYQSRRRRFKRSIDR